jgi:predicted dehydrogenase
MIRWLVVGSGRAGQVHLAALARSPAAEACGLVSRSERRAGNLPVFASLEEGIAASGCDGVIVATPPHTHVQLCRAAIAGGVPVLCEKPVGVSAHEAAEVARLAAASGIPVGVVLNQRSCRHARYVRALIEEGRMQPLAASVTVTLPRLGGWLDDPAMSGGGVLRTVAVHYLDLLRWWLGEPSAVHAEIRGGRIEDRVAATLVLGDGTVASVCATATGGEKCARVGPPVRLTVDGDGARLVMAGHEIVEWGGVSDPPPLEPQDPALWFGPGHLAVVTEASEALARGAGLPLPLEDALPSLALVDRIYAAGGRGDLAGG